MELSVFSQTLYGAYLTTNSELHRRRTAPHRLPVQMYSACAAQPRTTAALGALHGQFVTQYPYHRGITLNIQRALFTVNYKAKCHAYSLPILNTACWVLAFVWPMAA